MTPEPLLSILTPAVPSRLKQLDGLCFEIERQIGDQPVEHLVLIDNKRRTVGEKRDALLRAARGQFVAFVDDDDWISPDYVAKILKALETPGTSVVTFRQLAAIDKEMGVIEFKLGNPNEPFRGREHGLLNMLDVELTVEFTLTRRNAWHVCAWRRGLAICSKFPATNYGEDWAFAAPLCAMEGLREVHIPEVLHFYRHSSKTTEAPPPSANLRESA